MRDFWKAVSEWNKKGLKDYLFPTYKFNKYIFIGCFIIIVLTSLLIMNNHDWNFKDNFYFHCPENSGVCKNPYYSSPGEFYSSNSDCPIEDKNFCLQETFLPGYTYGEKIPNDIRQFPLFVLSIFFFGFVINHIWFNRRIRE